MKRNLMFLGLFVMMVHFGCKSSEEEVENETRFLVSSPVVMDTCITKEYVCQIHSIQHIELRALERGYLQKIYVDEGQFVRKGQLMFQIMPLVYQAEMQKAQAEAEFAHIEYQNTKALADSNVVSGNELALAKAKYDKAKAELALAQVHLGFTEIRAPFDGIMDRLHVRQGSLLDEGELLTNLSDNSKMWVYFNVPEAEYLDFMTHTRKDSLINVRLKMANNRIFDHDGVVEVIEADFNNETGNIAFRATFPNPEGLLRYGETGNILMRIPLKNVLLIPQKATYEILDQQYLFVISKEGVVKTRLIKVGQEMPHIFEIKTGLAEDEMFLLEGIRQVRNNEKIAYKFQKPDSVLTHLDVHAE